MIKRIFMFLSITLLVSTAVLAQGTSTSTSKTASTTEAAKKPAVFRATKAQVKQVQTILKDKKLYTGEASGSLDDATRAAIKSFQKDNGLKDTGALNRATVEKFGVDLTDSQKLIPVSPSSFATAPSDPTSPKPVKKTTAATTATPATGEEKPKRAAPFRATADQIKSAQKLLKDGKMYAGEETGKLDDVTREGLKKYQEVNGLKVTGRLNAALLEKMGIALTDKQKADAAAAMPKN